MESLLEVTREGAVGVLQLARPEKFNCLSMQLFKELEAALDALEKSDEIAAIVLSGRGKNFCTGAQLDEVEAVRRSEEHTSELQSLMRISYAVFCLKKKTQK